jgi:hypothetical protein
MTDPSTDIASAATSDVPPLPDMAKAYPNILAADKKALDTKIGADAAIEHKRQQDEKQYSDRMEKMIGAEGASIDELKNHWKPEDHQQQTGLWEAFGSPGFLVAMMGSAFSAMPMNSALSAGGAALDAIHRGDDAAYNRAYQAWKDNTKLAIDRLHAEHEELEDINKLYDKKREDWRASLAAHAAKYNDNRLKALLDNGMDDVAWEKMQGLAQARDQLGTAMQHIEEQKELVDAIKTKDDADAVKNATGQVTPEQHWKNHNEAIAEAAAAKSRGVRLTPGAQKAARIQELMDGPDKLTYEEAAKKVTQESKDQAPPLSPDTLRQMAVRLFNGDKSAAQGLGWGNVGSQNRAALQEAVTAYGKEHHLSPDEIGKAIATANASYVGETRGASALGQREALVTSAITSAEAVAPRVKETSQKVDRTKYSDLNAILLAGEQRTGDENIVRYGIALNTLISAYARAIGGTSSVLTDSSRHEAMNSLQRAWSKGQMDAAVDQIMIEMQSELQGVKSAQKEFMKSQDSDDSSSGGTSGTTSSGISWKVK